MIFRTRENLKFTSKTVQPTFDQDVDIVVVGLGTAGSIAAIVAGLEKKSVIGIEPNTYMGGVGTGGGIHTYCCGTKGGVQDEIDEECRLLESEYATRSVIGFHPDVKKFVLERKAIEAGVDLWYQSVIIGVFMVDTKVVGVQINGPDGLKNIKSKVVIDCSGDGEVCAMADCTFRIGRESDGLPQPYSFPRGYITEKGQVTAANFDAGYVDPTNGDAMSKAVCHAQSLHLKKTFDSDTRYLYTSGHLGLREGRFIIGEDTLSFSDLISFKEVPNLVFQARAFHDNHTRDWAFESADCQKWVSICGFWYRPTVANVPYGVVVPKGVEGLFVAGRCISIDHDSAQTFRMQRDMQKLGEVSARAASIAIDKNIAPKEVPYEMLKEKLVDSGCLPEKRVAPPKFENDANKIKGLLSKSVNGEGIWSAFLKFDTMKSDLYAWLESDDEHLSKNTAFVLALKQDKKALPKLREMVRSRDHFYFEKEHRAQERQWGAIFLLGEMKDEEIFSFLLDLIKDPRTDFQSFTQSMVTLFKLGDNNESLREKLISVFEKRFADTNFYYDLKMQISVGDTQMVEVYSDFIKLYAGSKFKKWGVDCAFFKNIVVEKLSERDLAFYRKIKAS